MRVTGAAHNWSQDTRGISRGSSPGPVAQGPPPKAPWDPAAGGTCTLGPPHGEPCPGSPCRCFTLLAGPGDGPPQRLLPFPYRLIWAGGESSVWFLENETEDVKFNSSLDF